MKLKRFKRKSSKKSESSTATSTFTTNTNASDGGEEKVETNRITSSSSPCPSPVSEKSVSSTSSNLVTCKRMSSGFLAVLNDTVVLDCERCGGIRRRDYNADDNNHNQVICECTEDDSEGSFSSALDHSTCTPKDIVCPIASPPAATNATGTTSTTTEEDEYSYENDEYNNIIVPVPPPMFSETNPPPRGYTVDQGIKDVEEIIRQMQPHVDDYKRKLLLKKHDETEEVEYFFRCQESQIPPKEYNSIKSIMNKLTEEEKDVTAKADVRFYKIALKYARKKMPIDDAYKAMFEDSCMSEIRNYLASYKGKEKGAYEELKKGLQLRTVFCINEARFAFTENPKSPFSQFAYQGCNRYIGDKPRCTVVNYDEEGRALLYLCGRFNTWHTRADLEGFLGSHGYFMERAIAATQTRTKGKISQVNVVLDFYQFSTREHTQPMFMLQALLKLMNQQFPQRVYRAYLVDPPFIARFVYKIVKPIVNAMGLCKEVVFVNGEKERTKYFGKVIGDPGYMDTVDVQAYYKTPFDKTYTDIFPIDED